MNIEQIYTGCLSQGAYYIESDGEVAIIDPLREVQQYVDKAEKDHAKIKYIFETHFHADFVSGHVTLSEKTGAPIVFGPLAETSFKAIVAKDRQQFKLGKLTIEVIHTPGHTLESSCYLLKDEQGKNYALFSGDTLFLGDVGRPDLAQNNGEITKEDLARKLYDSLRTKIMTLEDHVLVYPAHGAGSACGKNLSKETVGTIGEQKEVNYALRKHMTQQEFIDEVTEGLLPPPIYFPSNVKMNKEGYHDITEVLEKGNQGFEPEEFEQVANSSGALILDVRHQSEFIKGFIPNAIFIGLDGGFAPWVGALVGDVAHPILLVVDPGREKEAITRLSRVGFDNTVGYLKGGFQSWLKAGKSYDTIPQITALDLKKIQDKQESPFVFDVRKEGEFTSEHVLGAIHTPLSKINDYIAEFPENSIGYVHCAGGYRSVIALSILKSRGVHTMVDVKEGFKAIKEAGIETTNFQCPSKIK